MRLIIPVGWTIARLGELVQIVMGQAPPGKDCNTDGIGTVFVKAGEFGPQYPLTREWTTKPLKLARRGDVLICVVGATCGKLNLAIEAAIGRSVAAFRPGSGLITRFLWYQLMVISQLQFKKVTIKLDKLWAKPGIMPNYLIF